MPLADSLGQIFHSRQRKDLSPYVYSPLETKARFRLFSLYPGSYDDEVRIKVHRYHIDTTVEYAAISYVWGNPRNKRRVYCDNGFIEITVNLWTALKHLRDRNKRTLYWADAICINQGDDNEKSFQISLMPKIYPYARQVKCWLGEDDGTIESTFGLLAEWAKTQYNPELKLKLSHQFSSQGTLEASTGLRAFFERPWFRRAWTLQEVCVPLHKPPLAICGKYSLEWDTICCAFNMMSWNLPTQSVEEILGKDIEFAIAMMLVYFGRPEFKSHLSELVPYCLNREAADDRDKIWSVLGMAERYGAKYPAPDLTQSVEAVYITYTRSAIIQDQSLGIISWPARSRECDDSFPLWAMSPRAKSHYWNGGGALKIFGDTFRTSGDRTPVLTVTSALDDPILSIWGLPLGRVVVVHERYSIAKALRDYSDGWPSLLRALQTCAHQIHVSEPYEATGEAAVRALLRTMTANQSFRLHQQDDPRSKMSRESSCDVLGRHTAFGREKQLGSETQLSSDEFFAWLEAAYGLDDCLGMLASPAFELEIGSEVSISVSWHAQAMVKSFLDAVRETLTGRRLVQTDTGYLALASEQCMVGDHVCVLLGGAMPFMLRQSSAHPPEHFELIGEAYVHGAMNGEALKRLERLESGPVQDPRKWLTEYKLI